MTTHFPTREEFESYREKVWAKYTYTFGDWSFNWCTREVRDNGKVIYLTEREADVLKVLIEAVPMPLPSGVLAKCMREAHGEEWAAENVKVFVYRLRRKVGDWRIRHRPAGYYFNPFGENE